MIETPNPDPRAPYDPHRGLRAFIARVQSALPRSIPPGMAGGLVLQRQREDSEFFEACTTALADLNIIEGAHRRQTAQRSVAFAHLMAHARGVTETNSKRADLWRSLYLESVPMIDAIVEELDGHDGGCGCVLCDVFATYNASATALSAEIDDVTERLRRSADGSAIVRP